MSIIRFFFFISVINFWAPKAQTSISFPPVDDSKKDASFYSFKTKLKKAIAAKDVSFIKQILSEDIKYTFGPEPEGNTRAEGFLIYFNLIKTNSPFVDRNINFWHEIETVIDLGCTRGGDTFTCPYVFSRWPDKHSRSHEYIAVTRVPSLLKTRPNITSPNIRTLSYEILKLSELQDQTDWYVIALGNKKIGYLAKSDGRCSTDMRAEFKKTPSGWKLMYFIGGD